MEQPFLMSWGLIPWSQLSHQQMTYRKLLEQLQCCPSSTLDQTVTLYSIADDEFVPAYMTDYTDENSQILDPNHLVITF
jgi:hypothetical protein